MYFEENQRFPLWVLLLVCVVFLIPVVAFVFPLEAFNLFDFKNPSLFASLFGLVLILAIMSMRLRTRIDTEGISVKFSPFINRQIHWSDVESVELLKYPFYVGKGFRLSYKYGRVYNTAGNKGLFLRLKNGEKMLIGTQKAEELQTLLQTLHQKRYVNLNTSNLMTYTPSHA